jgi:undecaprenyl-diphosphatase
MDIYLFNLLHSLSQIELIEKVALFLSYPASYLIPFLLVIFAIYQKRKMFSFSIIILSGFFSWIFAKLLKELFHITRPFVENNAITPLFYESGLSFPSEHATTFASLSVVVIFLNKRIGYILLFITLLIGLSRVIIGVHYPSDIIGGFVLGSLIGMFFIYIFKKI